MGSVYAEQLRAAAGRLEALQRGLTEEMAARLDGLEEECDVAAKAWSGSNLGYHANVYYKDLKSLPPGHHFSSEWGLSSSFVASTTGDWREYDFDEVKELLLSRAGEHSIDGMIVIADQVKTVFEAEQSRFASLTISATSGVKDEYIEGLQKKAADLTALTVAQAVQVQLQSGQIITRDSIAANGGRASLHTRMF